MYCTFCGHKVDEDDKFCRSCGNSLDPSKRMMANNCGDKDVPDNIKDKVKVTVEYGHPHKNQSKPIIKLPSKDFCVVDIVTNRDEDTMVEVCAIKFDDGKRSESFSKLIKPYDGFEEDCEYLEDEEYCSNITYGQLMHKKTWDEWEYDFYLFLEDYTVIVFYEDYVIDTINENSLIKVENKIVDILPIARKFIKDVPNYKLDTLLEYFDINETDHRAMNDCKAQAKLYFKLLNLIK